MREETIIIELFVYYLIAINLGSFLAFGWDKSLAERGAWRMSESSLLTLAFLGGTPGAYAGRKLFRHKTRKQPFCQMLNGIGFMHLMLATFLVVYALVPITGAAR